MEHVFQLQMPAGIWWDIEDQINAAAPNETGRVLCGRWKFDPPNVNRAVVLANVPVTLRDVSPDSVRFIHNPRRERRDAMLQFINQGRSCQPLYLGTWHNHPTGGAEMSDADIKCLRDDDAWCFMVIAARALDGNLYPRCYVYFNEKVLELPWRGLYSADGVRLDSTEEESVVELAAA